MEGGLVDQLRSQIYDGLRIALAAGGPVSAAVLHFTGIEQDDFNLIVQAALVIVPPLGAWVWGLYLNSLAAKLAAVAQAAPHEAVQALQQVPVTTKLQIAEAIPEVATIVVKDDAAVPVKQLAHSDAHPNIVTATQNELDALSGAARRDNP